MSKLTKEELTMLKAIGYIEGNAPTIPDALKIGDELRGKVVAYDTDYTEKQARKAKRDDKAE